MRFHDLPFTRGIVDHKHGPVLRGPKSTVLQQMSISLAVFFMNFSCKLWYKLQGNRKRNMCVIFGLLGNKTVTIDANGPVLDGPKIDNL